ncbi:MAG: hypothetical protein JNK82_18130, partial [Myxococcaceae bacterium]|nr:hypothetical protein [Myxococcaceae bacterium]
MSNPRRATRLVLVLTSVVVWAGCSGGSGDGSADTCVAGTEGCPCAAMDTCATNARG